MVTRLSFVLVAAAVAGNSVALAQRETTTLVGQWTSETYVSGETGVVTLSFFPNGTYSRKSVVVTEFGWVLAANELLIAPVLEKKDSDIKYGKAAAMDVSFLGDSIIARAGGKELVLRRITGEVPEGHLLGRWESISDENETVVQDFRADGKLIVSVTQSREAGRYVVDDGTISVNTQIPMPTRKKWKFKLSGSSLLLYMSQRLPPLELKKADDQLATQRSY